MTQTIYLVRHCQASGQAPNSPLTELGQKQAIELAEGLSKQPIHRIVSSPFLRAYQIAQPLARCCHLEIETDARLCERVLCSTTLADWREKLELSFTDLDLCLAGGESSRMAMKRGMAAIADINGSKFATTGVITHGNLLTLLLKSLDDRVGFAEWQTLASPDVYRIDYSGGKTTVKHITYSLSGAI